MRLLALCLLLSACSGGRDGSDLVPVEELKDRFADAVCTHVAACGGESYEDCRWDLQVLHDSYQRTAGWPDPTTEDALRACEAFVEAAPCDAPGFWRVPECDFGQ